MTSLVYLASPYTHKDHKVRMGRYWATLEFVERLLLERHPVFSPIVYGYPLEAAIGYCYKSWQAFNDAMLDKADRLFVLTLDGWEASAGVAHEISHWERRCFLEGNLPEYELVRPSTQLKELFP